MVLKLNSERKAYEEFYGQNVAQMPLLIADRRVPMNVAQLMQRRLDVRNSDDANLRSSYIDNYFDTGDAVAYHPDGRVKVILDSQTLREMTPESPRNGGALIIGEEVYNALEGEEFKKGKLGKTGDWMSKKDVKAHPVWKVLARDQGLLDDYADWAFNEYKERFVKDSNVDDIKLMGIYPDSSDNQPKMRAWYVSCLVDWSNALGRDYLGDVIGRLLGIAPEALSALAKGASNVRLYSVADVQTAREQLEKIESFVRPDSLDKVKSLILKL